MSDYRKLDVWEKAFVLTVDTLREAENMAGRTASIVRDQMVRSVLSIPSNIAEGSAKRSDREFARFIRIALGSATETENHILVVSALNYMEPTICKRFEVEIVDIRKMLTGLDKRLTADADARSSRGRG